MSSSVAAVFLLGLLSAVPVSSENIVIIGAGVSGLAAAKQLASVGSNTVTVLEARNRLGGRLYTDTTSIPGVPIEWGAQWIHEQTGNPITSLAAAAGAGIVTFLDSDQQYNADGTTLSTAQENTLTSLEDQMADYIESAQNNDPNDSSLRSTIESSMGYSTASAANKLFIQFLINSNYEQEYAAPASQMSTFWFDNDNPYTGEDAVLPGGFGVLPTFLSTGLNIQYGAAVTSVVLNANGASIIYTQNSATQTLQVDRVICTVPLGVLKAGSITFSPALPSTHTSAISNLGFGVLNKVILIFPSAFWDTSVNWLRYIPDAAHNGQWVDWASLYGTTGRNILVGFNAATYGTAIEASSDATLVADALAVLKLMYGAANVPTPTNYFVTRWHSDPYARGSYSYHALGSTPSDRTNLQLPVSFSFKQRLWFAGEALSVANPATVHGAYTDGLRVASAVQAALPSSVPAPPSASYTRSGSPTHTPAYYTARASRTPSPSAQHAGHGGGGSSAVSSSSSLSSGAAGGIAAACIIIAIAVGAGLAYIYLCKGAPQAKSTQQPPSSGPAPAPTINSRGGGNVQMTAKHVSTGEGEDPAEVEQIDYHARNVRHANAV